MGGAKPSGDVTLERIHPKYRPVWERAGEAARRALSLYFLPHRSSKERLEPSRPREIKWYCPFADQHDFPSGHRYCLNVYVGCGHGCAYCYVASYQRGAPHPKPDFERRVGRDLGDLERFDVPPAPIHLSNSTDPFQRFERELGHTRLALEGILAHRRRFTTVTVLTKDPLFPAENGYVDLFGRLGEGGGGGGPGAHPAFQVEASVAFARESVRSALDPGAPRIAARIEGVRRLRRAGVPVVLRIDPLFPRGGGGDPEPAQTLADLESLVAFAAEVGVRHVVYSVAKIVKPFGRSLSGRMAAWKRAYEALAAPERLVWRGGSWRLPDAVAREEVTAPFLEICSRHGVAAKHCKANLLGTP